MNRKPSRRGMRWRDDTGSLALAMMLTLVGITLSALVMPLAINQVTATRQTVGRAQSLHAAQAGIDVALAHLRAARLVDLTGALTRHGAVRKLCWGDDGGWVTGKVADGAGHYRVRMTFLDDDRTTMPCPLGNRPPSLAKIEAIGSDDGSFAGGHARSLTATYVLRFTNANISGGLIRQSDTSLCLDAGSGTPAPGTYLRILACQEGSAGQLFAYNENLTISLTSSKSTQYPRGMCLDGGSTPANGVLVMFQPCAETTAWHQQWSISDAAHFQGTTSNGAALSPFCFRVRNTFVELNTCGTAFAPEPSVGAGAAGERSGQFVNFEQFGRCIDLTNFDVSLGFLIVWPCKQAPDPSRIGWNQRWSLPTVPTGATTADGPITTTNDRVTPNIRYCLKNSGRAGAPQFVQVTTCPTGAQIPDEYRWTRYGSAGLPYSSRYIIKDSRGRCLTPTDLSRTAPANDYFYGSTRASKLTLARCDGSKLQKWNADPLDDDASPLRDFSEQ